MTAPVSTHPNLPATGEHPARFGHFTRHSLVEGGVEFYRDNGFLILDDALDPTAVGQLRDETVAICRGERGGFSKGWAQPPEISPDASDDEVLRRFLCIHHPHVGSVAIAKAMTHPSLVDVLTDVIGPNVKCMQSMLFIKASGKPGQAWHQDEDYIPTRDRSLAGAWIALDDATIENGCLWVIPGSHRRGILWPQYPHDDKRFDCALMSFDFPYTDQDAVPVEVSAGSCIFFNGYLLHRSLPNAAQAGYRRSLVFHYMSAESLLAWGTSQSGESLATLDSRQILMVAGKDPYAYKGTTQPAEMLIRPEGIGGCGDGRMSLDEYKNLSTTHPQSQS